MTVRLSLTMSRVSFQTTSRIAFALPTAVAPHQVDDDLLETLCSCEDLEIPDRATGSDRAITAYRTSIADKLCLIPVVRRQEDWLTFARRSLRVVPYRSG